MHTHANTCAPPLSQFVFANNFLTTSLLRLPSLYLIQCYYGQYIDSVTGPVVLGTTFLEALKFNIGDSSPRNGLRGCYDALHIKLTDEEATRIYDFE